MMMKSADREYAARVIEGIISDKQSKGCANSCIECSKDSKGCARDPGFEWKYKGILEKTIELLREPVNDKNELKEAKRLLKAAVEDIVWLNEHTIDGEGGCLIETATDMETCLACPLNVNNSHICGWKHQVEALALIGEGGDTE